MFQHVLNSRPPPTRLPMNGVRSSFERVKFRQPGTKHRPDRDIERNDSLREKCATTAQEKARHLSRLKFSLGSLARRAITVGQDERIVQHDPWQCHASEEREKERESSVSRRERGEKPLLILPLPIFRRNSSWISSNQNRIAFHALEIAIQPWNNN